MNMACSALLVDDDPFTRTVLSATIRELGVTLIGAVGTATEAVVLMKHHTCNLAILDLDLGEGPTGIDLAHGLRRVNPDIAIILLSTYAEPRLIGRKQQDLPVGVRFLVKQSITESSKLELAIAEVLEHPLDSSKPFVQDEILVDLSDLHIEIIRLIAEGKSNAEIARLAIMEEGSVEKAIARIIKKIGVKADRTQNQRVMLAQYYFQITRGRYSDGD